MIELQGSAFVINQVGEDDLTVLNLAKKGAETFEENEETKKYVPLAKAIYNYGATAINALGGDQVDLIEETGITVKDEKADIKVSKPDSDVYVNEVSLLMGDAMGIRFTTNAAFTGKEVKVYLKNAEGELVETGLYACDAEEGTFDIFVSADEVATEFDLVITLDGKTALDATLSLKGITEYSYEILPEDPQVKAFAELAQACSDLVPAN